MRICQKYILIILLKVIHLNFFAQIVFKASPDTIFALYRNRPYNFQQRNSCRHNLDRLKFTIKCIFMKNQHSYAHSLLCIKSEKKSNLLIYVAHLCHVLLLRIIICDVVMLGGFGISPPQNSISHKTRFYLGFFFYYTQHN